MTDLWKDIQPINILCAVEQGFGVDHKYEEQVRSLARKGLVRLQCEWVLTDKGKEELERLFK